MSQEQRGIALVTWPGFDRRDPETGGALRRAGLGLRLAPKTGARSPQELIQLLRGATAAIVSTDPFDASVFRAARRLRVVARVGVGTDSIDLKAASDAGVVVTTTPGANEETVADHTMAMLLAACRRLTENDSSVRRGEWERAGVLTGWNLHGKTVGIVGYGTIGQAVGRRLAGFGVEILVFDPPRAASEGFPSTTLSDLLERSHIVTLHVPLSAATRGLIGRQELERMRPDATLVNTSRGGLVDESALVAALSTGRLRAAALDVFEVEPPTSSELLQLPNVVLTPHVAGLSDESIRAMTRQAVASVIDVLEGHTVSSAVDSHETSSGGV